MSTQEIIQTIPTLELEDLKKLQAIIEALINKKSNQKIQEDLSEIEYPKTKIEEWQKIDPNQGKLFTNLDKAKIWLNN